MVILNDHKVQVTYYAKNHPKIQRLRTAAVVRLAQESAFGQGLVETRVSAPRGISVLTAAGAHR